jgi:hypothetical protein
VTCQTPGAEFTIHIEPGAVEVCVTLPSHVVIGETRAQMLEADLHAAFERALAPLWPKDAA